MPDAEVVDGHAHAEVLEVEEDLRGQVGILHGGALGDLDLQEVRIEAGAIDGVADHGDDVRLLELAGGDIDGDSHPRPRGVPRLTLAAGFFDGPLTDGEDQARIFGDADELHGTEDVLSTAVPAD